MVTLYGVVTDAVYPSNRQSLLLASWFGASFTWFIFCLTFLIYISSAKISLPKNTTYQLYQALPENQLQAQDSIVSTDARSKILANFFQGYNSVLAPYSQNFIQTADKYELDWRLLPSIAMQESNGGRIMIHSSFNPFGFGIYGSSVVKFSSFEEGIEKVAKTLRENYLNQGLKTHWMRRKCY